MVGERAPNTQYIILRKEVCQFYNVFLFKKYGICIIIEGLEVSKANILLEAFCHGVLLKKLLNNIELGNSDKNV